MTPGAVVVGDEMPITRSGKVHRRAARAWLLGVDPGDLSTLDSLDAQPAFHRGGRQLSTVGDGLPVTGVSGRASAAGDFSVNAARPRARLGWRVLARPLAQSVPSTERRRRRTSAEYGQGLATASGAFAAIRPATARAVASRSLAGRSEFTSRVGVPRRVEPVTCHVSSAARPGAMTRGSRNTPPAAATMPRVTSGSQTMRSRRRGRCRRRWSSQPRPRKPFRQRLRVWFAGSERSRRSRRARPAATAPRPRLSCAGLRPR